MKCRFCQTKTMQRNRKETFTNFIVTKLSHGTLFSLKGQSESVSGRWRRSQSHVGWSISCFNVGAKILNLKNISASHQRLCVAVSKIYLIFVVLSRRVSAILQTYKKKCKLLGKVPSDKHNNFNASKFETSFWQNEYTIAKNHCNCLYMYNLTALSTFSLPRLPYVMSFVSSPLTLNKL